MIAIVAKTREMRTTTNFLLTNLAVADIITLLWAPIVLGFSVSDYQPPEEIADFICTFFAGNGVTSIAMSVSVLTLTILSIERYHALVKPYATKRRLTKKQCQFVIPVVWVASVLLMLPVFTNSRYYASLKRCIDTWNLELAHTMKAYVTTIFAILVITPFFLITLCYSQIIKGMYFTKTVFSQEASQSVVSKRKLTKTLLLVTIVFYMSYLPFTVLVIYCSFIGYQNLGASKDALLMVFRVFGLLGIVNSSLNPILYAFRSANYRAGFKNMCRFCRRTVVQDAEIANIPNIEHNNINNSNNNNDIDNNNNYNNNSNINNNNDNINDNDNNNDNNNNNIINNIDNNNNNNINITTTTTNNNNNNGNLHISI